MFPFLEDSYNSAEICGFEEPPLFPDFSEGDTRKFASFPSPPRTSCLLEVPSSLQSPRLSASPVSGGARLELQVDSHLALLRVSVTLRREGVQSADAPRDMIRTGSCGGDTFFALVAECDGSVPCVTLTLQEGTAGSTKEIVFHPESALLGDGETTVRLSSLSVQEAKVKKKKKRPRNLLPAELDLAEKVVVYKTLSGTQYVYPVTESQEGGWVGKEKTRKWEGIALKCRVAVKDSVPVFRVRLEEDAKVFFSARNPTDAVNGMCQLLRKHSKYAERIVGKNRDKPHQMFAPTKKRSKKAVEAV